MGYYTQYKLIGVEPKSMYQIIKDELSILAYPVPDGSGPDCDGRAVSPWIEDDRWGNSSPGCKWYSCDEDADAVSAKFPDVEFSISRMGEEDPWFGEMDWYTETWINGQRTKGNGR